MAGDRIVSVDDSAFVGKIVTNNEAMKRLKGKKEAKSNWVSSVREKKIFCSLPSYVETSL